MTIFDLDHIFVTFAPGAGGNFIAGLLDKINSGNLSELYVSSSGSSHVVNNGKVSGGDSISFGSNPEENTAFSTVEDREAYYLNRIANEYTSLSKVITWTHDFSNLPLYKKHFNNCRSLAITTHAVEEKLVSTIMHVNKVILSDESDIPIPTELWAHLKARLKKYISIKLESVIGTTGNIDHIFDNRCSEYNDLVFYLSTVALLKYTGLYDVLKLIGEPVEMPTAPRNVNIRDLISHNTDAVLPYSYLINNDVQLLQTVVAKIFNKQLTVEELEFIRTTFNSYRAKQNIDVLTDPLLYFNNRKIKAIDTVKRIKAGTA